MEYTKTPRTAPPPALLTPAQAAEVWGVSERTFHKLRVAGRTPQPVELGPRLLRWPRAELEAAAANLPRRSEPAAMPERLAAGKVAARARRAAEPVA
ncbi:MAG: hypothetical protein KGI90_07020 [Burkholderiales bacterium]|nr:hypothetical protein [Burkholderiales bacterium]